MNYRFYERSAPKIIARLLDTGPLVYFKNIGFLKQEENKLEGQLNDYKIFLSPLANMEGSHSLVILIPLEFQEGLDSYFTKYNDKFRFSISDGIIFAEAILQDFEKKYAYEELLALITTTITGLRDNKIGPLKYDS